MKKIVLLFLLIPSLAFAGITKNVSETKQAFFPWGTSDLLVFDITSDGSGDVASTNIGPIHGRIVWVKFEPDETDTTAATADIYLYDQNDTIKLDLLGGEGVNLSATANTWITPLVGSAYNMPPFSGDIYFVGDEMGASKKGRLIIFIER